MEEETELFSSLEDGEKFVIAFDKIFDREKIQCYNVFDLTKKRNFKMISNTIKETYETIFLNEDGTLKEHMQIVLLQILNVQSKIMKAEPLSVDKFNKFLEKIAKVGESALLKEIDNYVDNNYQLSLDEDTKKMKEKNKAVNEQLIISDDYAKTLIKIAYLDRIMIPIISNFYLYSKDTFPTKVEIVQDEDSENGEDLVFSEINQTIFNNLFKLVAKKNTENIQNKIYKMVYARIIRTSFSAKKFWTVAETLGISKESSSLEIYAKLISNSLPKIILSKDLNVVNYLSTIINNQINFLFSNKFHCHYQTINPSMEGGSIFASNDDNMTEMEKMEINLSHKNEGSLIINNVIAGQAIEKIDQYMDVAVSKEEIANTLSFIHMNPIQEKIVAMLTFKYFKSTDAIKRLNAYDYAKLLICCVKYLEKQKFVLLPKILMSACVKQRERTAITGVKVKSKIEETKRYKELFNTKYADFKSDAEKTIQALISTIYSSTFIDEKGEDVFESSAKIGNVAEEIIDMCFLI